MKLLTYMSTAMLACAALCAVARPAEPTKVHWQILANDSTSYNHRFTVTGNKDIDALAFNMFARPMTLANAADTVVEIVPGYYEIRSSRFGVNAPDTLVFDINTRGFFAHMAYCPDGVHAVKYAADGRPMVQAAEFTRGSVNMDRKQWLRRGTIDLMPYGDEFYYQNQLLAPQETKVDVYDVIPSFKNVKRIGGQSALPLTTVFDIKQMERPEQTNITINNGVLTISAADSIMANRALLRLNNRVFPYAGASIDNVEIVDWPDFGYRGLMIDISRNYQTPATMHKILEQMAIYGFNVLHFHFADDEAWRLDMPSLPELTQVGARRGYTKDEKEYMVQIFAGNGDPDTQVGTANGYYTRQDYIDILRHAKKLGIVVLPEVESPGHARAAIKAMEKRYRDTGDDSLRLIHDGDTSTYTSAQSFHDNVMNPALESTYRFMDLVFGDLQDMYAEAGVELPAIHIGGDEVAKGAWNGSQLAKDFMAAHNLADQHEFHGYFVERIGRMLQDRGLKMSGWQEIAVGHSEDYNRLIAPETYSVNCWHQTSTKNDLNRKALEGGYPVVLSNVNHYYMDMCYSDNPEENGLTWGGVVDEFISLAGYPDRLRGTDGETKGKVVGLSGHLFAETIRSPEQLELYLLPKSLGLAERAWNADSTYTNPHFNAVIDVKEIPAWQRENRHYHLRQPGVIVQDGKVKMNSPYRVGQIRYTLDGSDVTSSSPLYQGPFDLPKGVKQIRARLYRGDNSSVTTVLLVE